MLIPSVFKESLLDDLFDRDYTVERQLYGNKAKDLMKVDIKENDHDFELFVDLPGFKKENLTLDLTNGYLTITGNKTIDKEENKKYIRKERFYGTVSRSFYVGDEVKKEDIKAKGIAGKEISVYLNVEQKAAYYTVDGQGSDDYKIDLNTL